MEALHEHDILHERETPPEDIPIIDHAPEGTPAPEHGWAPRIQLVNAVLAFIGALLAIVGIITVLNLIETRADTAEVRGEYESCTAATNDLMQASDSLTMQARTYVLSGERRFMDAYLDELLVTRSRDQAVATLARYASESEAAEKLTLALAESNELAELELYAMRLTADALGDADQPEAIATVELSVADAALDADGKRALAQSLVLGSTYDDMKALIVESVNDCSTDLADQLMASRTQLYARERRLQYTLLAVILLDAALLVSAGVINHALLVSPMRRHKRNLEDNEPLDVAGSEEMRNVVRAYNRLYAENLRRTMLLRHQAQTDSLTDLLNRGSFDRVLTHHGDDIALIMLDVDHFKEINDANGHEAGDAVLRKVGSALRHAFRSTDYVCRIGGDEFAVVLTEMGHEMRSVVTHKLDVIRAELADDSDGVPRATVSVGVAFSASLPDGSRIYHAADKALYEAKSRGRDRYVFFEG